MKVLFVTNHPIQGASSRYRVYQFLPYLQAHGVECTVRPFTDAALYRRLRQRGGWVPKLAGTTAALARRLRDVADARHYDVVFLHREAFPFGPPVVELALARANPKLIVDFDDAIYLRFPYAGAMRSRILYRIKYGRNFARVLRAARLVIAGNRHLAEYATGINARTEVIPTVVDPTVYAPLPAPNGRPLTVGWIGSDSTAPHLDLVRQPLEELASKFQQSLRIRVVGLSRPLAWRVPIEQQPWDLAREVQDVREMDIGIMPLHDTPWTRGKCAFKAIQSMAAGVPTISSPVGTVTEFVEDGRNGFLAATSGEWMSKLSCLVQESALRRSIGLEGRRTIEEKFSLARTAPRLLEVLQSVA